VVPDCENLVNVARSSRKSSVQFPPHFVHNFSSYINKAKPLENWNFPKQTADG